MVTTILFILAILFFIFFIIYKRDMIAKMFSLQAAVPASELQHELEKTADEVIRRLEAQIAHLELLLDEADIKIEELDRKLQLVEKTAEKRPVAPEDNISSAGSFDFSLPPETPAIAEIPVAMEIPVAAEKSIVPEKMAAPDNQAFFAPDNSPLKADNSLLKDNRDGINNDKRRTIISLSEQGYSVTEIAKLTGMGKGEIILFLQLNRK